MNEQANARVQPTSAQTTATVLPRRVRAIKELPGPRGLPLLGNLRQLKTARLHTILSAWANEFGPMYRFPPVQ